MATDKDALIQKLVAALNRTVPFIGYQAHVPEIEGAAKDALKDAHLAGFATDFGRMAAEQGVKKVTLTTRKGKGDRAHITYATVRDADSGELEINATLEFCNQAIKDRGWTVVQHVDADEV